LLLKLAFRNIFRNFRRTFFTFLSIAVGIATLITLDSYMKGLDLKTFEKIVDLETGHIKFFAAGYKNDIDNLPLENAFDPAAIVAALKKDPEVIGVTARVNFRSILSNGNDQLPAFGIAADPAEDSNVFKLMESVDKGEYLAGAEEAMLIGNDLAKDFDVSVGDTLTVLTRTKYSTYQALDLKIKGILLSENYAIDMNAIVIPLGLAQGALELGAGVTEVDVRLKDERKINEFKKRYTGKFTGTEVWTWKEVAEDVLAHSESHAMAKYIIFIAVILIALVGITNTVMIAVFERTREIGMMAAMGMKRNAIVTLFVLEGAMIGLMGSIIGCLFGVTLVVTWTTKSGFDLSFAFKSFGNIGFRAGKFLGVWNPEIFLSAFIFGVVVSALTSIYPALVASRLSPTEALRKG